MAKHMAVGTAFDKPIIKSGRKITQTWHATLTSSPSVCRQNQFAYIKKRGARDAIAYMMLIFIQVFALGQQIGVYCSDVSGAFDRVASIRLHKKLKRKGLPSIYLNVLRFWLVERRAFIELEGHTSRSFKLCNMVFQGTVLGPILWNAFFEDSDLVVATAGHKGITYADDLHTYKIYDKAVPYETVVRDCEVCRDTLHTWGYAMQVVFDPDKESIHVLSLVNNVESHFKFWGCIFDSRLQMQSLIHDLVTACKWKSMDILRSRCLHTSTELIDLYKAQIQSYIEYRTPALYHAVSCHFETLDAVQQIFLDAIGVSAADAILYYNLAPLNCRWDMAMLGVIHRSAMRYGPPHF